MHKDEGFTLVELSVALAIALIITGLAYEMYLFTSRVVSRWERGVSARNAAHLIARQIADDVRRAKMASVGPQGKTLTLTVASRDTVRYRWKEGAMRRNGRPIHPHTVRAAGVGVRAEPLGQRLRVDVVICMVSSVQESRSQEGADEAIARRAALPADTTALSLRVMTRRPAPWPAVSP